MEIFLVLGAHWYIKGQNVLMSIISLTYFNKKEKERKYGKMLSIVKYKKQSSLSMYINISINKVTTKKNCVI